MTTVRASIMQTPLPDSFEVLHDQFIEIGIDGRIETVRDATADDVADVVLGDDHVLIPGMVDTHLHAPQWPQLGTGLDLPLDRWLFEVTFPLEARFSDVAFAARVWDHMVPALLAEGTTTVAYYGSRHLEATTALAEACVRHGQRALVGRVAMDHPTGTPEWYRDASASEAVDASARSVELIRSLRSELVQPIITPRFIPACTDAALVGLAELAAATGERVQTHCSESDWEHATVLERCGRTDAAALDDFGLVRQHTVLAHATHLDDADREIIAGRGAGVAHCPLSNVYFANQPFSARRALDAGVRVGLGTDVAGGPSPSLLSQCGHAIAASQRLVDDGDPAARIDAITAFWMATLGGADLLGLDVGLLAPGRWFDAIAVSWDKLSANSDVGPSDGDDALTADYRRFEKLVHNACRDDIASVWVAGRRVVG